MEESEYGVEIGLRHFMKEAGRVSSKLNALHEYVAPKYTEREREEFGMEHEYGGITGNLRKKAMIRIARVLAGDTDKMSKFAHGALANQPGFLDAEFILKPNESIFCDVGSGSGRPSLYLAGLRIKASVGFDVDPMQVFSSCHALSTLCKNQDNSGTPVIFFHGDVLKMASLEPCTHIYSFMGYPDMILATTLLVAKTKTCRVFVAVVTQPSELRCTGALDALDEKDGSCKTFFMQGLQMPSGKSYLAAVIPLTPKRREHIINTILSLSEDEEKENHERHDCFKETMLHALNTPGGLEDLSEKQLKRYCGEPGDDEGGPACDPVAGSSLTNGDSLMQSHLHRGRPKRQTRAPSRLGYQT